MIHGKDSNIKQRMILCALVLLFPPQTNVDLVHFPDSLSEPLNVRAHHHPSHIHVLASNYQQHRWESGHARLERKSSDVLKRSVVRGEELGNEEEVLRRRVGGLDPARSTSERALPGKLQVDFHPHASGIAASYGRGAFK